MSEPTKLIDRGTLVKALEKWADSEIEKIEAEGDEDPDYNQGFVDGLRFVAGRLRDGRLP